MTYQLHFTINETRTHGTGLINYRLFAVSATHVGEAQRLHGHGYATHPSGQFRVNYCKYELFEIDTIA
ncbi:hypothetical protein MHAE_17313 [Mycobacterium haemophilum DSM 44634]|uniref:hypothetical protein n=1 Tax=Mycobacterium haemophilum TaxID=29311 RepID=UPI0006553CF1|nr:hypothetical protein [Mycobacterium haemophilum]AKN16042.1 hypothetical protein B586_04815 [Mycobacterium haemophilum DSM 44634]